MPKGLLIVQVLKFKYTVRLAVQLAGRDHFLYRILVTHAKLKGK